MKGNDALSVVVWIAAIILSSSSLWPMRHSHAFVIIPQAAYYCNTGGGSTCSNNIFNINSNINSNNNNNNNNKNCNNVQTTCSVSTAALPIDPFATAETAIATVSASSTIMHSIGSDITDIVSSSSLSLSLSLPSSLMTMGREEAEQLAGPFFGASLFPYLAFLWLLAREENQCPKGVTVGFTTLLFFVFLTIPAAIAAQVLYGVSLADSDWLHGSAESLLTVTNLITVIAFRQALEFKEQQQGSLSSSSSSSSSPPASATSYTPMTWLFVGLITVVAITALVPAISDPLIHTPYLGGFMDLPSSIASVQTTYLGANMEPDNALTIATWIIHVSSLVEFLVAMGFAWRWATIVDNPTWKGLTWGLLPLHSSGITACTYHLFYNRIPFLVPLQALLTCVGNITAAIATYRICRSNGWKPDTEKVNEQWLSILDSLTNAPVHSSLSGTVIDVDIDVDADEIVRTTTAASVVQESESLVGFEDLGQALAGDNDYSFLLKLFAGCAVASYIIKYGETYFDFPYDANPYTGLAFIFIPSGLNAYKWYRRGQDPSFEGWF